MGIGYEGWAKLKVDAVEDLFLCTGAANPKRRVRLESSSGYGGQIKLPVDEIGIGTPRNYDWESFDGSLGFDVTQDLVTNQIKPWIFARQKAAQTTMRTRKDNVQQFDNCYWNNISLTAGDGSLVTGSIGYVAIQRDSYVQGGDYVDDKTGDGYLCDPGVLNVPEPLGIDMNESPIPFWNSSVEVDGDVLDFVTWTLDFSQEVVKFFSCEASSVPAEPRFIAVGPMTVTFTGDYFFAATTPTPWDIPDTLATLTVNIAGETIDLANLELSTDADDVRGQNDPTVIAVDYAAYELVA